MEPDKRKAGVWLRRAHKGFGERSFPSRTKYATPEYGAPTETQRSGFCGERRSKGACAVFAARRERNRADFATTQNPGIDHVLAYELPQMKAYFHKPVMANVSGFSVEDYVEVCRKLDGEEQVGWLEVNISCPNVHGGGMSFGTDPASAAEVTRAVKAVTHKPVLVKLSPNVTDIAAIARACEEAGADGISLINTVLGMRLDLARRKPLLANTTGGLSGPAIFPLAVRMVYQVYEAVSIPIVGMGGVTSARDVMELMLAGATAVEVGAANLTDPLICQTIIRELPQVMKQYHIERLEEIIGGAHHG